MTNIDKMAVDIATKIYERLGLEIVSAPISDIIKQALQAARDEGFRNGVKAGRELKDADNAIFKQEYKEL